MRKETKEMINGYYYSYGTPMMNYMDTGLVVGVAAVLAVILGVVLYFTVFSKKNEDRYTGWKGKLYNFMTLNRFYAEDLLKFLYVIAVCIVTVTGIAIVVLGSFISGIIILIGGNVALRLSFEFMMMFIMMCRKTVSMDRNVSRIAAYYDDGYGAFGGDEPEMTREEWEAASEEDDESEGCGGSCGSCGETDCGSFAEDEIQQMINEIKE